MDHLLIPGDDMISMYEGVGVFFSCLCWFLKEEGSFPLDVSLL